MTRNRYFLTTQEVDLHFTSITVSTYFYYIRSNNEAISIIDKERYKIVYKFSQDGTTYFTLIKRGNK